MKETSQPSNAAANAAAIVPAGGTGSRMAASQPKQYLPLLGQAVIVHTLDRLQSCPAIGAIIVVVRPEDMQLCTRAGVSRERFSKLRVIVPGGCERWASVRAGMRQTQSSDHIIVVHDAVRPFVTPALVERVAHAARLHGAAVAALPVTETIKQSDGRVIRCTLDRSRLWKAQTPQAFRRDWLLAAHESAGHRPIATDDAMLVEQMGRPVQLVPGDACNLKITTREDLEWAEFQLNREHGMAATALRIGQGYDVHALVPDRPLVLGGISIPFERGLAGHSDADVLTHAVIDALLGAVGEGDIGRLFPDTDQRYAGIRSIELLRKTWERLAARGARIVNVDAILTAQRPRLSCHLPAMVEVLSGTLQMPTDRVSVKATTTEHLGFVGREEGIAAQAVALVDCPITG